MRKASAHRLKFERGVLGAVPLSNYSSRSISVRYAEILRVSDRTLQTSFDRDGKLPDAVTKARFLREAKHWLALAKTQSTPPLEHPHRGVAAPLQLDSGINQLGSGSLVLASQCWLQRGQIMFSTLVIASPTPLATAVTASLIPSITDVPPTTLSSSASVSSPIIVAC
jgi:hypothetical protein